MTARERPPDDEPAADLDLEVRLTVAMLRAQYAATYRERAQAGREARALRDALRRRQTTEED